MASLTIFPDYKTTTEVEHQECGTLAVSNSSLEKSQAANTKEQAQKRVQEWVNQPHEQVEESCSNNPTVLPPLEDPSIILTSPEFPKKKSQDKFATSELNEINVKLN